MTTAHARGVIPVPTGPQRLMLAREYRSLTQSEMAEQLGVGLATVYRAESGKTTPRRTTIMAYTAIPAEAARRAVASAASSIVWAA